MKVKVYNSAKYQKTTTYNVEKITCMPEPDEIEPDDIEYADGAMLGLWLSNGGTVFVPHSFLIEILP